MNITTRFDYPKLPAGTNFNAKLMVGVEAGDSGSNSNKQLNLSLVLDRSGSMTGEKIAYVKAASKLFLSQMKKGDYFSLVVFDDKVNALIPPTKIGSPNHADILIDNIQPGGSTNLAGGYKMGYNLVKERKAESTVSRVILLTDGLANVGITDPAALAAMSSDMQSDGITTSTIGVGDDYDETLLGKLAENGGGGTYLIETPDDAPDVFREELGYLQSLAATDLEMRFVAANRETRIGQLNTYRVSDGGTYLLGDVYGGQQKNIVFDLQVPEMEPGQGVLVGTIHVSYKNATSIDGKAETQEIPVLIDVVPAAEFSAADRDREVVLASAYLLVAKTIRDGIRLADDSEFERAADLFEKAAKDLEALELNDQRLTDDIADLRERARNLRDHGGVFYSAMEKKSMYLAAFKGSKAQFASRDMMNNRRAAKRQTPRNKRPEDSA